MIYIVFFILSIVIYRVFEKIRKENIGILIMLILLSVLAGCRDLGVGTDTMYYSESYHYLATHYNIHDLLFRRDIFQDVSSAYFLLNYFSLLLGNSIALPFFFTEFCILGGAFFFFIKFQKKYRFNFALLILLYLFLYYNQSYNYMRQLCGVSFTFGSYYYFTNKKYIICILMLLIGYAFHTSAIGGILPIAIHFISNLKTLKVRKKLLIIYLLLLLIICFSFNFLLTFFSTHGLILDFYADRYGVGNEYGGSISTAQSLNVIFVFILILVSWRKKICSSAQIIEMFLIHVTYTALFLCSLYAYFLFRLSFFLGYQDLLFVIVALCSKKQNASFKYIYVALVIFIWVHLYVIQDNCETYPYTSKILSIF